MQYLDPFGSVSFLLAVDRDLEAWVPNTPHHNIEMTLRRCLQVPERIDPVWFRNSGEFVLIAARSTSR